MTVKIRYTLENAVIAYRLALVGMTDAQIADVFGVSLQVFMEWQDEYDELRSNLFRGRAMADGMVAESMFKRAIGYQAPAVKMFLVKPRGEDGGEPYVLREHYIEHYPPDSSAGQFWMTNRQPEKWKNRSQQALTDAAGNTLPPPVLVINAVAPPKREDEE